MTDGVTDMSRGRAARLAGSGWLIIIVAGILAEFFIRMPLIVPGDAAATAANITGSEGLFRTSIAVDLVMLVLDVLVALALYVLFEPTNRGLALLAAFFRLVMDAVLGINLVNLVLALSLSTATGYLAVFETGQLHALAMQFIDAHGSGYDIGLVFFGLHLLLVGYLIHRSGYLPGLLGLLLVFASIGYLVDSFASILLPQGAQVVTITATVLIGVAVLAELALSLWLLFKGAPAERPG